jgi:hypothetical protein
MIYDGVETGAVIPDLLVADAVAPPRPPPIHLVPVKAKNISHPIPL